MCEKSEGAKSCIYKRMSEGVHETKPTVEDCNSSKGWERQKIGNKGVGWRRNTGRLGSGMTTQKIIYIMCDGEEFGHHAFEQVLVIKKSAKGGVSHRKEGVVLMFPSLGSTTWR